MSLETDSSGAEGSAGNSGNTDSGTAAAATTDATQQDASTLLTGDQSANDSANAGNAAESTELQNNVPEQYADFVLPDGAQLDERILNEFLPLAKAAKLTQEQAQAMVEQGLAIQQKAMQDVVDAFQKRVDGWRDETLADKEIGGDKLTDSLAKAAKVIDTFGPKDDAGNNLLKQVLDETGLGNHPVMVKLMTRIGAAISEDQFVAGEMSSGSGASLADRLYPTMKQS